MNVTKGQWLETNQNKGQCYNLSWSCHDLATADFYIKSQNLQNQDTFHNQVQRKYI